MDREVTNKVLEALSLQMQETSIAKEIAALDNQIQVLTKERQSIESVRNQYAIAQSGAVRAATVAKEMSLAAEKKIQEGRLLAEKAIEASKEADKFAAMTKRVVDFNTPINAATKALGETDTLRKQQNKSLNDVKFRREELRKQGYDINAPKQTPSRLSI